jgi:hypothetical protein
MDTATHAPAAPHWRTGRLVGAILIGLLGALLTAAAAAGLWTRLHSSEHGYVMSGSHRYAASGRAIVSGSLDADGIPNWLAAKFRIAAASADGKPLFVGVGRRADVDRYLAQVAHSTVEDVNFNPFAVTYSSVAGSHAPAPPAAQTFWAESHVGTGTQTVSWKIRSGHWRAVVMNADGSRHVVTAARVGTTIRGALPIALSVLAAGLALLAVAAALGLTARLPSRA